jgi:hypothetical protein
VGEELGEQMPAKFVFRQAKRGGVDGHRPLPSKGMIVQVTKPAGASIFKEILHVSLC